jgi:AcrR family transcriptional regulator
MGVKERREREKETLRREILDAASELFVQEGYQSVSMRKIADKIEYSPTTIYLYFRNKADLLATICDETFEQMIAVHAKITAEANDPISGLRKGLRAYVDFGLAHPSHYVLTFMTPFASGDFPDDFAYEDSPGGRSFDVLREAVRECVERGAFRDVDVAVASQALWSVIHGLTSLLIAHPQFPWADRDTVIDTAIDAAIRGFSH